uniref:Uncharacterized protein n=1 Tax=Arundo donax TaxID=35708 RepID=A0A0A9BHC2_ARUDO
MQILPKRTEQHDTRPNSISVQPTVFEADLDRSQGVGTIDNQQIARPPKTYGFNSHQPTNP